MPDNSQFTFNSNQAVIVLYCIVLYWLAQRAKSVHHKKINQNRKIIQDINEDNMVQKKNEPA